MPLLSHLLKRRSNGKTGEAPTFPAVRLETAMEGGEYAVWVKNHRWSQRNEKWCRTQIEKFNYKPTISILMQCKNPREEFLRASFASAFNQIYPFHEFFVVDRGSSEPKIRELLEKIEQDPRVKVSFQKGSERDLTAIAKIMKKTESEWILLMTAEDVLEPYILYNMVGALQDTVDIDFVFSDSDLIDDRDLRFAPQFKPVWAVGAHYPLGYYQHPVLLHERLVKKLNGHERISELVEEGTLLDEASNHSRYVVQAPGMLYHGRSRGSKNEIPPEPVYNVLMNENLTYDNGRVRINPEIRIQAEPRMPLRLLWVMDRMDLSEATEFSFYLSRFLKKEWQHSILFIASQEGTAVESFREIGDVVFAGAGDLSGWFSQQTNVFDAAFVTSDAASNIPEILHSHDIPHVWQIRERPELEHVREAFELPETVLFSSATVLKQYNDIDRRGIARILAPTVDVADIKLFIQQNSPFKIREQLGLSMNTVVLSVIDPTIEQKSQHTFVEASLKILAEDPQLDVRFFIVGARKGNYFEQLQKTVLGAGKIEIVYEESRFENNYPYYFISDICVSCSLVEVFPLSTLKAMAFKKAVLGTDVFATNEIIRNGWNGYLFPPGDADELSARMMELIRNSPDRDMMARRSLEIAREKFDLRKVGATLERYFRESIVYVE